MMLNEKKIRYMTKAAAYETGAEKKNIEICSFGRTDYIGLQILKSAGAYTLAFGCLAVLWAGGRLEELMLKISNADYAGNILKTGAVLYIAGLFIYEIAIYFYASKKYRSAKESVAKYHKYLKNIQQFYEEQETEEKTL